MQDGILYKLTKVYLVSLQISMCGEHFLLTLVESSGMLIFDGGSFA